MHRGYVMILNFTAEFTSNFADSSLTKVGMFFVGYVNVMVDTESTDQSRNCDSRPLRAASAVIPL